MMLVAASAERYSIGQVAARLRVHPSTIWRWILKGTRGHKLSTITIGGRRFVLARDLDAFLAACNAGFSISSDDLVRRADNAGRLLDAQGVKVSSPTGSMSGKPRARRIER